MYSLASALCISVRPCNSQTRSSIKSLHWLYASCALSFKSNQRFYLFTMIFLPCFSTTDITAAVIIKLAKISGIGPNLRNPDLSRHSIFTKSDIQKTAAGCLAVARNSTLSPNGLQRTLMHYCIATRRSIRSWSRRFNLTLGLSAASSLGKHYRIALPHRAYVSALHMTILWPGIVAPAHLPCTFNGSSPKAEMPDLRNLESIAHHFSSVQPTPPCLRHAQFFAHMP